MSGPVAPKDPEKDRSYFYIMKEKERKFSSLAKLSCLSLNYKIEN